MKIWYNSYSLPFPRLDSFHTLLECYERTMRITKQTKIVVYTYNLHRFLKKFT